MADELIEAEEAVLAQARIGGKGKKAAKQPQVCAHEPYTCARISACSRMLMHWEDHGAPARCRNTCTSCNALKIIIT